MESIITPATHTPDQLDHRLGWFVGQFLRTIGYMHISTTREAQIHIEFASQLESLGLWDWSIYVLLHLHGTEQGDDGDAKIRKKHVCQGNALLTLIKNEPLTLFSSI